MEKELGVRNGFINYLLIYLLIYSFVYSNLAIWWVVISSSWPIVCMYKTALLLNGRATGLL